MFEQVDTTDLVVLGDGEAHRLVQHPADRERDDERVDQHREGADRLGPELAEAAPEEEPVVHLQPSRSRRAVGGIGEQPDEQGADEAADEVHSDDVEAVVEAEAELEADRERAADAGDEPDDQGPPG